MAIALERLIVLPAIAINYWHLPLDATLRDVIVMVRADEAHHRDVNHAFASELAAAAGDIKGRDS